MTALTAYKRFVTAMDYVDACDRASIAVGKDAAASALADADYEAALKTADERRQAVIGSSISDLGVVAALARVGFEHASILATLDHVDPQLIGALERILAKIADFAGQDPSAGNLVHDEQIDGLMAVANARASVSV